MKKKLSHIPIIPLGLNKEDIDNAIGKELIVDYSTNNIYLYNDKNVKDIYHFYKDNPKVKEGETKPDDLITTLQKRLEEDRRHEIISPDQRRVYGVNISFNESNPTFSAKYVEDAIGYKNLYIDQTTGEIDYGSWEELITNFFGVEPVLMENGKEVLKIDPNDYNRILDKTSEDEEQIIYGFELDLTAPDGIGIVKYTNRARGNIPAEFTTEKIDYGSWKDFLIDFVGVKPTAIKDIVQERYDLDPNHYDVKISQDYIEDDHIMIRFKRNFYKIQYTENKLTFKVANYRPDSTYTDEIWTDGKPFYMGAYEGIQSKSNIVINPEAEGLNNLLLGKRYFYVFCIAIMVSRSLEMNNLGYFKYNHYDNHVHYDIDDHLENWFNDPYGTRKAGYTDHLGFNYTDSRVNKTFGAENAFGNGGQNNVGVYADGGKLIYEIPDENGSYDIKRVIHLENRLLDYRCREDRTINLAFGIGEAIVQISMPARLFI